MIDLPTSKPCKRCGIDKPLTEFSRQRLGLHGHRSRCKGCIAVEAADYRSRTIERRCAYNAAYREAHRSKIRVYNREWNRANPERIAIAAFRHAALIRGSVGDFYYLTIDKLRARFELYAGRCAYCGAAATTFDHRIPVSAGGPHLPANLLPACRSCNSRKHRRTEREFRKEVMLIRG